MGILIPNPHFWECGIIGVAVTIVTSDIVNYEKLFIHNVINVSWQLNNTYAWKQNTINNTINSELQM